MIKKIIAMAIAVLMLSGCSTANELESKNTSIEATSSITSTTSEATTSKSESEVSTNVSKPVSSTTSSASSSKKPAASTSSAEKPVVSSSTTSSTTSKTETPVEKPVHSHTFTEATCEKPAICTTCGETSGNALGHNYAKATCEKPETCTRCGATNGNALGHSFTDATCTTPETCVRCGVTRGTTTEHNYKQGVCTNCGKSDPNFVACDPFNNDDPNHVWKETYTKTEPKWHYEMHDVGSNGFDITLAKRYGLCTPGVNTMTELDEILMTPEMGAPYGLPMLLNSGSGSMNVRVWAIETYTTKTCINCGDTIEYMSPTSFEQLGEWEFPPDTIEVRKKMYNSIQLWYDMYNIPQSVLDEIAENTREILGM